MPQLPPMQQPLKQLHQAEQMNYATPERAYPGSSSFQVSTKTY